MNQAQEFYGDSRGPAAEPKPYRVKGDCDGFPRILDAKTAPGLCLGLVDGNSDRAIPMHMPRAIAAIGDDFVVTDMAGWGRTNGQVFLLKKGPDGKFRRFLLIDEAELPGSQRRHLYMPSTVKLGPDGKIWIGATSSIFRFDPHAELFDATSMRPPEDPKQAAARKTVREGIEIMVDGLPFKSAENRHDDSLHPLKPFVFSPDNTALYVGVGASTDNCGQNHRPQDRCQEGEAASNDRVEANAAIYRFKLGADFRPEAAPTLFARGIRNSLALAFHPKTAELFQGENSRDPRGQVHASRLYPPDELNLIVEGRHYGWPYCAGFGAVQKEYAGGGWDCAKYARPHLLLPPHSAPLQMLFYSGSKLPDWYTNKLIVALHGYEEFGHRISTFDVDADARPKGEPRDLV